MESLRQIGAAILLAVVSVVILLGGFLLAMAEGGVVPAAPPASPTTQSSAPIVVTIFPTLPLPVSPAVQSITPDFTATASLTPPPTLIVCPPPTGWVPIVVQPFHTLTSLSQVYRTSVDLLRTKNCLLNDQLVAGSILYVPPLPTSTVIPCGAPPGWGSYTVIAGDTLYRIGLSYRVTVQELMQANCLTTTYIKVGQVLRVPRVPTSTPPNVPNTQIPPTEVPTLTPSEPAPTTEVPSPTTVPATVTATSQPTNTPLPSATPPTSVP
jgi:hypothetical protein